MAMQHEASVEEMDKRAKLVCGEWVLRYGNAISGKAVKAGGKVLVKSCKVCGRDAHAERDDG